MESAGVALLGGSRGRKIMKLILVATNSINDAEKLRVKNQPWLHVRTFLDTIDALAWIKDHPNRFPKKKAHIITVSIDKDTSMEVTSIDVPDRNQKKLPAPKKKQAKKLSKKKTKKKVRKKKFAKDSM